MTTFVIDKNGASVDASTVTLPGDRHFRNAWSLDQGSNVIEEDVAISRELMKEKMREARSPLLAAEDVIFMKALETSDSDVQAACVERKVALRDCPAASAIANASTIGELKAAWPSSVLGDSPFGDR